MKKREDNQAIYYSDAALSVFKNEILKFDDTLTDIDIIAFDDNVDGWTKFTAKKHGKKIKGVYENNQINFDAEWPSYHAQQKWQEKAGLISKTYKLSKELTEEFKKACENKDESQAQVLTRLMQEYINNK